MGGAVMKHIQIVITYDDITKNVEVKSGYEEGTEPLNTLNDDDYNLVLDIFDTAIEAFTEGRALDKEIDELTK